MEKTSSQTLKFLTLAQTSSQSISQSNCEVGKTESGGEMGSFLPLWMDDKLQPLQNTVSLGKRLSGMNIELDFTTFRNLQLWWLICVLLFPSQAQRRRQPYRITEKFRHPKPAMQSKALHWCLGDFWRTVPPQAPRQTQPPQSSPRSQLHCRLCLAICTLPN